MPTDKQNIYQIARKAAGLTQEKAAELLPVSVRSLRDYEEGQRVPGNDVVERMCVVYNAQHLAYQHLHEKWTSVPYCAGIRAERPDGDRYADL